MIFFTKNAAYLHSSCSSTIIIDFYGDYLFAISMEIYHELSEYLLYVPPVVCYKV